MQIGMLGPFEVRTGDGPLADVPGARLRALLIALALEPDRSVPKATLVDWIWGERPPADAANALQRLVSRLRKVLPAGMVEGQPDGYRLRVAPDAVDAVRFERLVTRAGTGERAARLHTLREALALWRGPAMQDVGLQDSDAFDAATTRLDALRLSATEDRFDAELDLGNTAGLVTELTDLVAAHPVRERLVIALMRTLVATGRDTEALLVYQRTREALADTLGVDPSPELSALHVALLRGEVPRREDTRKTNLRAELTTFVGKDDDVAAIRALTTTHRLTTLIGPGGSGKTRLAAETARTLLPDLPDGAWLVELASTATDGDVAQATLASLNLRDALLGDPSAADPTHRLIAALQDREALLVLDNCEHVIDSAATFAHRVLGECRRLRILATSREPLNITGEALWPVVPLATPQEDAPPAEIASSPAVRLLRDRATAVRRDLPDTAETLTTMARICRALDGMPLAIELAAARLRTMSLDQLATRLDDRFRLLTSGSRTALPRHRTLRAVVDWSWDLLTEEERAVLAKLSVFTNGASLEAAEKVCTTPTTHQEDILPVLTSLTEKSLLTAEVHDHLRYRMTSTIKEYATQKLTETGEATQTHQAHRTYFITLAETAEPQLRRNNQLQWLKTLAADHDNITTAMRNALNTNNAEEAMRLAAAAGWYWWLAGNKTEGMDLLTTATTLEGEVPDETKATVYALISMFVNSGPNDEHDSADWILKAHHHGQHSPHHHPARRLVIPLERMLRAPTEFLTAWHSLLQDEDPWVRALARLHLGKMHILMGDGSEQPDNNLRQALTEFQRLGERFGTSFALLELADRLATRGNLAEASTLLEQAATTTAELNATEDTIRAKSRLAQLYWLQNKEEESTKTLKEAEQQAKTVTWPAALATLALTKAELATWQNKKEEAHTQLTKAITTLKQEATQPYIQATTETLKAKLAKTTEEAAQHHKTALTAATKTAHAPTISTTLTGLATLALRQNNPAQAIRLLTAATKTRGLPNLATPETTQITKEATPHLTPEQLKTATEEGQTTPWQTLAEKTLSN